MNYIVQRFGYQHIIKQEILRGVMPFEVKDRMVYFYKHNKEKQYREFLVAYPQYNLISIEEYKGDK